MDRRQCVYLILGICVFITVIYLLSVHSVVRQSSIIMSHDFSKQKKPNFVFILTDDQDSILGSLDAMKNVKEYIGNAGVEFVNSFVVSPLCCPSRSSILSGQYVHNHKAINNSINGGCSSKIWQNGPEKKSFVSSLNENGYQTFFAGKYLNQYGNNEVGGLGHIPPGWDWWIGLAGNSKYYDYSLSVNGTEEKHGNNPKTDYLTNVIKRRAMQFLDVVSYPKTPFFMMLSTPACHAPFEPEPKYSKNFTDKQVPRTKNFNVVNDDSKHWLLRLGEQPLNDKIIEKVDDIYRKRLRTLLTVDDLVKDVIVSLEEKGLLNSTYIIFTSDNGYHLGQFSLPLDKREPYEFDIRVPFLIRGPGISKMMVDYPVTNIDVAPTILDLANIEIPRHFDGTSLKYFLEKADVAVSTDSKNSYNVDKTPLYNSKHFVSLRKTVLVEHSGEGHDVKFGCDYLGSNLGGCNPEYSCKCEDSRNNTYSCLRHYSHEDNFVFCMWEDEEHFEEFYNLNEDLNQLNNTVSYLPSEKHKQLRLFMNKLKKCRGSRCNKLSKFVF